MCKEGQQYFLILTLIFQHISSFLSSWILKTLIFQLAQMKMPLMRFQYLTSHSLLISPSTQSNTVRTQQLFCLQPHYCSCSIRQLLVFLHIMIHLLLAWLLWSRMSAYKNLNILYLYIIPLLVPSLQSSFQVNLKDLEQNKKIINLHTIFIFKSVPKFENLGVLKTLVKQTETFK